MNKINKHFYNTGFTLVEVIIATSIILVFLITLFEIHSFYLKTAFTNKNTVKASQLAEEGLEVVRFLRNSSWDSNIAPLALETNYYLVFESGAWATSTTQVLIDNVFDRKITFSSAYRDIGENLVSSGGAIDPNTLLVTSTVSWPRGEAIITKSISTYITNIFEN